MASWTLRRAVPDDAEGIRAIYNPYVEHTIVTFEQVPVTAAEMAGRIQEIGASYPWFVAEARGAVIGYAYATQWRSRAAYDRTVESTVYVAAGSERSGVGRSLYAALLDALRAQGVHAVLGCIALPNDPSVALHERCGFRKVAHFPEVGRKLGRWVDVGFWQIEL